MYLLYSDASGTPALNDNSRHYVLVGICVHEGTWFALNKRLLGLKRKYCFTGEFFELHASQFAVSINEQNQVPGFENMSWTDRRARVLAVRQQRIDAAPDSNEKRRLREKYKKTEPFIHLTRLERSRLLEDGLELVGAHTGIRLFGEAISKAHPGVVAGTIDPVKQAFAQVLSRFDAFLRRHQAWRLANNPRAVPNNGLVVLDQDHSTEASVHQQFVGYRERGHPWGSLTHVIDVPFFASSERVCGLQLVDVCAYAVRRYLDRGAVANSFEEQNFLRIFHRFDRDDRGKLHGLRHFVPAGTCTCLICQSRLHAP